MQLTPVQSAAVTHHAGPALVLAGAGSGKTRVLCHRLAWLIDSGVPPEEILALTFTREAAIELRQRAEDLIGSSHETLRVTTFHSHALELERVHGMEWGLLDPTEVARPEERALLLMEHLDELELRHHDLRADRARLVDELIRRIDACRDQLVEADTYLAWAEAAVAEAASHGQAHRAQRELEFARVFVAHEHWMADAGLEDFGLSIQRALKVLRAHPDRLEAARSGCRHVLVDEFQDTNHAQAELLYLLSDGNDSLMVVGDDDQGIYRFRGASVKNIIDFRARFPQATELRLEVNHRSGQAILDAATAVVAPIADRAAKRSVALEDAPSREPIFWRASDPAAQARAVVEAIRGHAERGIPLEEQAVLMRAVRLEARAVVDALERAGLPHQVRGGVGLLERHEVRMAIAWLRATTDPADAQAHLRIATDRRFGLPWAAVSDAVADAAPGAVTGALLGVADDAGATGFVAAVEEVGRAAAELPAAEALRAAIDRSGLRGAALSTGGAEGSSRLAGLAALERLAWQITDREPTMTARELAARLVGLGEIGFRGEGASAAQRLGVQVMTIHQAKGLEFEVVAVIGLTRSSYPGANRLRIDIPDALLAEAIPRGRDAHVAEARRLAYVAMTRAKGHLILSHPAVNESGAPQVASPFVEEARTAVGAQMVEVGHPHERDLMEAISQQQTALTRATLRAAQAVADGVDAQGMDALWGRVDRASRAVVAARAAALAPTAPPPPPNPARRPARPGIDLTPSAIETYRTCPLRYRFSFVDRIPSPPSIHQRIGTAVHAALEAHYRPEGRGGDGHALVERLTVEFTRTGLERTAEGRQALTRAGENLPAYHDGLVRSGAVPWAVERPFTLTVGPHRVHGRIDRIDRHGAGGHQLVDYKTGSPPRGTTHDDTVMQLYLLGARESFDIEARGATVAHILDNQTRTVHPDGNEMEMALDTVKDVAERVSVGDFAPRPSWACRSCEFALLCPAIDR